MTIIPQTQGKNGTVSGWRLIDVYTEGSLKMGVYIPDGDDWQNPSEYAIVNKGTSAANDWDDNLLQPLGASGDMKLSLSYAVWFSDSHADIEITFVGHSKGGGEAMANAVATNRDAITFNPAKANLALYDQTKEFRGRTLNDRKIKKAKKCCQIAYVPRFRLSLSSSL